MGVERERKRECVCERERMREREREREEIGVHSLNTKLTIVVIVFFDVSSFVSLVSQAYAKRRSFPRAMKTLSDIEGSGRTPRSPNMRRSSSAQSGSVSFSNQECMDFIKSPEFLDLRAQVYLGCGRHRDVK